MGEWCLLDRPTLCMLGEHLLWKGFSYHEVNPLEMPIILQALSAGASCKLLAKRGFPRQKHEQALGSPLHPPPPHGGVIWDHTQPWDCYSEDAIRVKAAILGTFS